MVAFLADQLGLDSANFSDYAERDQTRRAHLADIQATMGYRVFDRALYREFAACLLPTALASDRGVTLTSVVLEELRARRIIVPTLPVIKRLCGALANSCVLGRLK